MSPHQNHAGNRTTHHHARRAVKNGITVVTVVLGESPMSTRALKVRLKRARQQWRRLGLGLRHTRMHGAGPFFGQQCVIFAAPIRVNQPQNAVFSACHFGIGSVIVGCPYRSHDGRDGTAANTR